MGIMLLVFLLNLLAVAVVMLVRLVQRVAPIKVKPLYQWPLEVLVVLQVLVV